MTTRALLEAPLPEVARRAGRDVITALVARLEAEGQATPEGLGRLLDVLGRELEEGEERTARLISALSASRAAGGGSAGLLDALAEMSSGAALSADLAAVSRDLDEEALELRLRFELQGRRQGWELLSAAVAAGAPDLPQPSLRSSLRDRALAFSSGRSRPWTLRAAAVRLAAALCDDAPGPQAHTRQGLVLLAQDELDHPWVASAALEALVGLYEGGPLPADAREARSRPAPPERRLAVALLTSVVLPEPARRRRLPADHAFVRARGVALLARLGELHALRRVLREGEGSEHVRIEAARSLAAAPQDDGGGVGLDLLPTESRTVVAAAALTLLPDVEPDEPPRDRRRTAAPPGEESEPLPVGAAPRDDGSERLRIAAELLADGADRLLLEIVLRGLLDRLNAGAFTEATAGACARWFGPLLEATAAASPPDEAAELAGAVLGRLRLLLDEDGAAILAEVERRLDGAVAGDVIRLRRGPGAEASPAALLEVLGALAFDGHDLGASPLGRGAPLKPGEPGRGWTIHVGQRRRPQPWRIVHELLRPRPDKRQAGAHASGSQPSGTLVALSAHLGEVTPTGVPGRRVSQDSDRLRWASELPPPGIFLAAARRRGGVEVLAPGGRYLVRARGPWGWLRAQRRFVALSIARERLRHLPGDSGARDYDALAERWGFEVQRRGGPGAMVPAMLVLPGGLRRAFDGLLAVDTNTLLQLAVLSAGLSGAWLLGNVRQARAIRRQRASIPLVIGGWGSRGKSGSERLKAALFHDLGYSVVAKTTGCEAMVVLSVPGADPVEVPLYRPRDKASIVEQRRVLDFASRLGSQVLLWECMALNPMYVDILQNEWMRDDYSTITNTYPDHEDVHGPGGEEVAETISVFLPRGGRAISTEQHMAPILRDRALAQGTDLRFCRREEWELLPRDLLERIPYEEHPRNVAMVTRLAVQLGIPRDVTWKAIADEVVPDLGVLKRYGPVPYGGRRVAFVNGMSANERAGFISNWARVGLERPGPGSGLDEWLVLLVNNRGDRPARQTVFAALCAVDATFDTLAVIGTNVRAFCAEWRAGLEDALRPRLVDLASGEGGAERLAVEVARRLRRPRLDRDGARQRLIDHGVKVEEADALLAREWSPDLDADRAAHRVLDLPPPGSDEPPSRSRTRWLREVAWVNALAGDGAPDASIDALLEVLGRRLLPLLDPALDGDEVFDTLSRSAPEGAAVTLFGSANIKGTGLQFVHRCLAADRASTLGTRLAACDAEEARGLLQRLVSDPDMGRVDAAVAMSELEGFLRGPGRLRAQLSADIERALTLLRERQAGPAGGGGATARSIPGLDLVQSLRCRRQANVLMRDLGDRRVGLRRAAAAVRGIIDRER